LQPALAGRHVWPRHPEGPLRAPLDTVRFRARQPADRADPASTRSPACRAVARREAGTVLPGGAESMTRRQGS